MSEPNDRAPPQGQSAPRTTWRSVEEHDGLVDSDRRAEFPPFAELLDPVSRRGFLQLLGASAAAASLAACSRPVEKIVPYARDPVDSTPGKPSHYASAATAGGYATGLLVTAYSGRPTKIEGNPDHPASLGATGAREQAELLQLYDPQRARMLRRRGRPSTWRGLQKELREAAARHAQDGGARLRLLLEPTASPLLLELRGRIRERFPRSRAFSFAPAESDNPAEGARLAFGQPLAALLDFEKADVVVALDSDFTDRGPLRLRYARAFARRRTPGEAMNRLYSVESTLTPTGTLADHRLALRPTQIEAFARALYAAVAEAGAPPAGGLPPQAERVLKAAAADLRGRRGRSLVVAGEGQPPLVHALAYAMNAALGNVGSTIAFVQPPRGAEPSGPAALAPLVQELRAGAVDTLLITAFDPAYSAPADLGFADALSKVPNAVYHALYEDETSARCAWFVPAAHFLESWGDARSPDGMASLVQPLVQPLFGGVTEAELLAALLGEGERGARALLEDSWRRRSGAEPSFAQSWVKWLADGVVPDTQAPLVTPSLAADGLREALAQPAPAPGGGLEVSFVPDRKVHDGRYANNAWLQELPEPILKLTWDNAALLSPATAKRLGVASGDVVELELRGRRVRAPATVLAGQADETVTVSLGYGRRAANLTVANGVGFDANLLRSSERPWTDSGLQLTRAGERHALATTQHHWTMDGREIALSATRAALASGEAARALEKLRGAVATLHEPVAYRGHKWGMAVDLGRCTSCSACVVACQAENNIPVVGKAGVLRGREMHWLRIDRYYEGTPERFETLNQPMLCQHCENAPCEYVCPVNATVHSDEGLNEMVYNRCVGTRYCSNNCPYKVRRFNYLAYTKGLGPTEKMRQNPEVTVRSRGVMEKCTFCVQRIERGRIDARVAGEELKDGAIRTACQQACPTEAIVFGDLNDPGSRVRPLHEQAHAYEVLHELGTRPRVAYLARVRNPNPELER